MVVVAEVWKWATICDCARRCGSGLTDMTKIWNFKGLYANTSNSTRPCQHTFNDANTEKIM
jgi:hypothetical protein